MLNLLFAVACANPACRGTDPAGVWTPLPDLAPEETDARTSSLPQVVARGDGESFRVGRRHSVAELDLSQCRWRVSEGKLGSVAEVFRAPHHRGDWIQPLPERPKGPLFLQGVGGSVAQIGGKGVRLPETGSPEPTRTKSAAMHTNGEVLVVWGGVDGSETWRLDGALFDVASGAWEAMPEAPFDRGDGGPRGQSGRPVVSALVGERFVVSAQTPEGPRTASFDLKARRWTVLPGVHKGRLVPSGEAVLVSNHGSPLQVVDLQEGTTKGLAQKGSQLAQIHPFEGGWVIVEHSRTEGGTLTKVTRAGEVEPIGLPEDAPILFGAGVHNGRLIWVGLGSPTMTSPGVPPRPPQPGEPLALPVAPSYSVEPNAKAWSYRL